MRTRRYVLSLIVVLMLAAGGVVGLTVLKKRPNLGLDLRGGLSIVLTAKGEIKDSKVLDKTVEVVRQRVDDLGAREAEVSRSGDRNIVVQIPGVEDPVRARQIIGKTAQLRFREVVDQKAEPEAKAAGWQLSEADPVDKEVIFREGEEVGATWFKLAPASVVGEDVKDAYVQPDQQAGGWTVQLELTSAGTRKFAEVTERLKPGAAGEGKLLAIVLDRVVESAPQVRDAITNGQAQISGQFTQSESNDLALVLRAGALPIELEESQVQRVSPTLGSASLRSGLLAGAIGLGLVALYMLLFYRLLGFITLFGLGIFGSLVLGLIGFIGERFTLTLAGIAGIIVAVGIAADSYIIYFERIKDELKEGKTFRSAVDRGFASAFKTNVSANLVAFSAAFILYLLAVGSVKGFALTLGIASLFDILLLYFYTHPAVALIARNKRLAGLRTVGMREAVASA